MIRPICPKCKGTGVILEKADPPYEDEGPIVHTCENCKGTGKI